MTKSLNSIGKTALVGSIATGALLVLALIMSYTTTTHIDFWHTATFVLAVLNMGFGAFSGWLISRSVHGILAAQHAVNDIQEGRYEPFNTDYMAELGDMMSALLAMQERIVAHNRERERHLDHMQQVQQALDVVSTNVMITDAEGKIIYANASLEQSFNHASNDFRQINPDFGATKLINTDVDSYHRANRRLAHISNRFEEQFSVGDRQFRIVANPVHNQNGVRLGTVVEWTDRTDQIAIEEEVQTIVHAAKDGDLTQRVDLSGKQDFFAKLAHAVNELVGSADNITQDTLRVLKGLSVGDLSQRIDGKYQGTFAELKIAANETSDRLTKIAAEIQETANQVTVGTKSLSTGNSDLSRRTESQSNSLKETASSMIEMTNTVRENSTHVDSADQLSKSARKQAEAGGLVVSQAEAAMQEINTSSTKISAITNVINEIAFQTNLLALNAAVEAARAGEQGKGFAVVASEVRSLAQRSGEAAKKIEELIRDSVKKVLEGTRLVDESGKTLSEIVKSVNSVSEIISDIARAGHAQLSGIDQVNQAINSIDDITHKNAGLVKEAAISSENLMQQSYELNELVSFFKTTKLVASEPRARSALMGKTATAKARPKPQTNIHSAKTATNVLPLTPSSTQAEPVAASNEGSVENWEAF